MNYVKKSILIGLLSFIVSICVAGDSLRRFYYAPTGFSVEIPQFWEIRQKENENMYAVAGISPFENQEDAFQEILTISISKSHSDISIDKHSELNRKSMEKNMGDFKIVEETNVSINDRIGRKMVYLYGPKKTVKEMLFFGLHNKHLVVIKLTTTIDKFRKYGKLFDEIINSIEIKKI